jgi:hypothetical protein
MKANGVNPTDVNPDFVSQATAAAEGGKRAVIVACEAGGKTEVTAQFPYGKPSRSLKAAWKVGVHALLQCGGGGGKRGAGASGGPAHPFIACWCMSCVHGGIGDQSSACICHAQSHLVVEHVALQLLREGEGLRVLHMEGGVLAWHRMGMPMVGEYDESSAFRTPNAIDVIEAMEGKDRK